jgi:hypothetical protein
MSKCFTSVAENRRSSVHTGRLRILLAASLVLETVQRPSARGSCQTKPPPAPAPMAVIARVRAGPAPALPAAVGVEVFLPSARLPAIARIGRFFSFVQDWPRLVHARRQRNSHHCLGLFHLPFCRRWRRWRRRASKILEDLCGG